MSRISCISLFVALAGAGLWGLGLTAQESSKTPKAAAAPTAADATAAIQASGDAFEKAYNAHDAKALSEQFIPEALVYFNDSRTFVGRNSIQAAFASVFEATPQVQIELTIRSVDMIGPTMAVEQGTVQTTGGPGAAPDRARYVVLHVHRDGDWQMALVRDMPDEPKAREHLLPLAWMVGDWIDESREGKVSTSCRWDANHNFLLQDITVRRAGKDTMHVTQRIGWDPLTKRVRSWIFDSEGGYGESLWTRTETGWLIKATGVRPDGAVASSTNSIHSDGFDAYGFRSVDRIAGDEIEPDVEVRVVRRPPEPVDEK